MTSIDKTSAGNTENTPRKGGRRRRYTRHSLWLAGGGAVLALFLALVQPFYTLSLFSQWFNDLFYTGGAASPNIVIAAIDDDSEEALGRFADWPRGLHAQAIANLKKAGATVIAYDVVFANASPEDGKLVAALQSVGNVVLAVGGTGTAVKEGGYFSYDGLVLPETSLAEACTAVGHVNVTEDADKTIRRLPLVITDSGGDKYPSLSLSVLTALFHVPLESLTPAGGKLTAAGRDIPVDDACALRLNFAGNITGLPAISYADVVRGDFDPQLVKNKIVLVGMTSSAGIDTWALPSVPGRVPGVYIHAAALDTILRENYLREAGRAANMLIMLGLVTACALLFPAFGTRRGRDVIKVSGLAVLLLVGYLAAVGLAAGQGTILDVFYPVITLGAVYTGSMLYSTVQEASDKRFVKELFGRYVSPQVSQEIMSMADSGGLKLGGEEREISVLFADIRGFTTISEKMTPAEVVAMLNNCLPLIINAVADNGGMVNKFAGDCIMGVWNAPARVPNHAFLAVKAAWEAQQKMVDMQHQGVTIRFGIGINTGKAIAGNLGSFGRSEYTVIGDTVNLASRICGAAGGGEVWLGPDTYEQIKEKITSDALEPQTFKGKTKPVPVFRVTGFK
jgi:adenylate cyclase